MASEEEFPPSPLLPHLSIVPPEIGLTNEDGEKSLHSIRREREVGEEKEIRSSIERREGGWDGCSHRSSDVDERGTEKGEKKA